MRIVFICGCMEAGRDGVGDYTRRLAGELIKQGHVIAILAIHDKYVKEINESIQNDDSSEFPVLRLSSSDAWYTRVLAAKKWIEKINPHWLSLQYVPFSFHPKGLQLKLHSFLHEIGTGRNWHIMFHELWVGMEKGSSLKFTIWGWLQKMQIKKLIKTIAPAVIQTQSKIYQIQLSKIGVETSQLPLFSNIKKVLVKEKTVSDSDEYSVVIFGSIHPHTPVEDFANEVKEFGKTISKNIVLKMIGRCGASQYEWENIFVSQGLRVLIVGERPADEISKILSESDLGISTTPLILAEKSGSVAAMWAHGLTVVCVSRPWKSKNIGDELMFDGIFEYKKGRLESSLKNLESTGPVNDSYAVARKFIEILSNKN